MEETSWFPPFFILFCHDKPDASSAALGFVVPAGEGVVPSADAGQAGELILPALIDVHRHIV